MLTLAVTICNLSEKDQLLKFDPDKKKSTAIIRNYWKAAQ